MARSYALRWRPSLIQEVVLERVLHQLGAAAEVELRHADVVLMRDDAANIVAAGERTLRVGELLGDFVAKIRRNLGQ